MNVKGGGLSFEGKRGMPLKRHIKKKKCRKQRKYPNWTVEPKEKKAPEMGHTIYFTTLQKKGGEKEKRSPVLLKSQKKKRTQTNKKCRPREDNTVFSCREIFFVNCCKNEPNKVKKKIFHRWDIATGYGGNCVILLAAAILYECSIHSAPD